MSTMLSVMPTMGPSLDVAVQRDDIGVHAALGIPGTRDAWVPLPR